MILRERQSGRLCLSLRGMFYTACNGSAQVLSRVTGDKVKRTPGSRNSVPCCYAGFPAAAFNRVLDLLAGYAVRSARRRAEITNSKTDIKMKKQILGIAAWLCLGSVAGGYAQSGVKYPYVQEGKIIVSRDAAGGVKSDCIHPNWTATPSHNQGDATNNRVAAKFEVANADASSGTPWDSIDGNCTAPWRLPTQRELMLMWVMKDQLTGVQSFPSSTYWSSTELSGGLTSNAWRVNFSSGDTHIEDKSNSYSVRCVRDVN